MFLKATNTEEVPGLSDDVVTLKVDGVGYVEIPLKPTMGVIEALEELEGNHEDSNAVMKVISAFIDYQLPEKLAKKMRRRSADLIARLFAEWMEAFQKVNGVALGES